MSVARAVGWGPEDRDGAPAGPRHGRSREGAGTCGCQGPLGPPRWPTWPGLRSTGCSCILGIRFRPERETETEIQRREGGEGAVPLPRRNPPAHMCKKSTSVFLLVNLTLPSGPGGKERWCPAPTARPSPCFLCSSQNEGRLSAVQGRASGPRVPCPRCRLLRDPSPFRSWSAVPADFHKGPLLVTPVLISRPFWSAQPSARPGKLRGLLRPRPASGHSGSQGLFQIHMSKP